ncbi:MAG TPA: tetratricopeptide repeat protein [Spirochaetota bacterium]|nr:tetratricopeptide repeat protein [Spirochaetota bacterium]
MKKPIALITALILLAALRLVADQSIESLKLGTGDLPQGYAFGAELMAVSVQPVTFYKMPDASGLMPGPVKKDFQTFLYEGKPRGSLLLFQYASAKEADGVKSFLTGLLWGEDSGPTEKHPDEMYVHENVVMIFCFGYRSRESLLVKSFLREKRKIDLFTPEGRFMAVIARAQKFYNVRDVQKGIDHLKKNYDDIRAHSFGHFFLAEFYYMAHEWDNAKTHYRSALDLHEKTNRLPDEGSLWAAHHGLGISCAMTGRVQESVGPFRKSLEMARALKRPAMVSGSAYDLSCSLAVLGEYDEAYELLAESIRLEKKYRDMARKDECFRDALVQKRFRDLLK